MFVYQTPSERYYFDPVSRIIYNASWKAVAHGFMQFAKFVLKLDIIKCSRIDANGNTLYSFRNVFRCAA